MRHLKNLSNFCDVASGIGSLAAAEATGLSVSAGWLQTVLGVGGIIHTLSQRKDNDAKQALDSFRSEAEEHWRDWAKHSSFKDSGSFESAIRDFDDYFEKVDGDLVPAYSKIVEIREKALAKETSADPIHEIAKNLAEEMLHVAEVRYPGTYGEGTERLLSRQFFRDVAIGAFNRLLRDEGYRQKLVLPILDRIVASVREEGTSTREKLSEVHSDTISRIDAASDQTVERLLEKLKQNDLVRSDRKLVLELVRRYMKVETTDFGIAIDLIEQELLVALELKTSRILPRDPVGAARRVRSIHQKILTAAIEVREFTLPEIAERTEMSIAFLRMFFHKHPSYFELFDVSGYEARRGPGRPFKIYRVVKGREAEVTRLAGSIGTRE